MSTERRVGSLSRDVVLKQLKARAKQLGELDNPDKKGWDQPRFRAWAELQTGSESTS